jgi:sulfur-oxidizing protein SoxX
MRFLKPLKCMTYASLVLGLLSVSIAHGDDIGEGKEIAFDRKKGNCLACHTIEGGNLPGNLGPPLVSMKQRFPDVELLRAQIYNPLERNPDSLMPPFGLHNILTDQEINKLTVFIHNL